MALWLGERVDIIVLGQGFVRDGDQALANKVDDVVLEAANEQ